MHVVLLKLVSITGKILLLLEVQVVFNCYFSAILKFCSVIVLILNAENQFFKFKKMLPVISFLLRRLTYTIVNHIFNSLPKISLIHFAILKHV